MQNSIAAVLFVEATRRVFMVCEPTREVVASRQNRFNERPGKELQTHSAFAVNVRNLFDYVPEILCLHPPQTKKQCVLLI
jgi:hypothetical protein